MENKVVCDYCGTIYDGSREKCPLCGSTTRAEAAALMYNFMAYSGILTSVETGEAAEAAA